MRTLIARIVSGSLLIAGTTIGAGMLGIPLLTAQSGLYPALFITLLVWVFMLSTGLLIVEATLWMPERANILTITRTLLGREGRFIAGGLFLFLYYSLMVAYIAGGGPVFLSVIAKTLGFGVPEWLLGSGGYIVFTMVFGAIVFHGVRSIDRVNTLLVLGMVVAYGGLIGFGSDVVDSSRFDFFNLPAAFTAAPVLFSAFGYHNIIPSLCHYSHRDKRALRFSIFLGTFLAFIVYCLWQWLILGAVPIEKIIAAKNAGLPASVVLEGIVQNPWLERSAASFAFFALVTSLLGVALSMVDFIADGLPAGLKKGRLFPTFLTFMPPLVITMIDPTIFDRALGIAGGFGEAFLNGLLPVLLVWIGRYHLFKRTVPILPMGKFALVLLGGSSLGVFCLEIVSLLS